MELVTRLTYNCGHLRATKESLIIKYDMTHFQMFEKVEYG